MNSLRSITGTWAAAAALLVAANLALLVAAALTLHAAGDPARTGAFSRTAGVAGTPGASALTINRIVSWLHSDGLSNNRPWLTEQLAGGLYPYGFVYDHSGGGEFSGRPIIYADGLLWGGKPYLENTYTTPAPGDSIRAGGQTYSSGTRAGWITGTGASAVPVDRSDPRVRVYRIRRDYVSFNYSYEGVKEEAAILLREGDLGAVTTADLDSVRNMYKRDWLEWPVDRGAPYIERNGQPGYQPPPPLSDSFDGDDLIAKRYDEPGIAGPGGSAPASQVLWTVFNDLDSSLSVGFFRSLPLGLEIQCTMWGYLRSDGAADLYFRRYRIINKGGVDLGSGQRGAFFIDSMYIGQWSDPDIGYTHNDLCGCDPDRNMGFVYNATGTDAEFQAVNLAPPAVANGLLQGPVVPGAPGDSATVNFARVHGKKNLPMSSFLPVPQYMLADDPFWPGPVYWYRLLRGYAPYSPMNDRWPSGPFPTSPFPFSGDPVTGQGFIDGRGTNYSPAAGDRRFVMGSGPFRLTPGDTQEVIIATVAGLGADNLSSISVMRFNDRYAKSAHQLLYDVPVAPRRPQLKATALSGEILLEWGSDQAAVDATEKPVIAGFYRFEGYSVYQLPSPGSSASGRVRIATFDVLNNVARIITEEIDPVTGLPVYVVAQEGTNSGIQRHLSIREDFSGRLTDPSATPVPLRNGQQYTFAVTAYNFTDDVRRLPRMLESDLATATIRPQIPFGAAFSTAFGDTLPLVHLSGWSDQPPGVLVVDPTLTNGNSFQLTFAEDRDSILLKAADLTRGITRWSGRLVPGEDGPLFDGILVNLLRRETGMSGYSIPSGIRRWTWTGSNGLGLEGFSGAMGYARAVFPLTSVTPGGLRDILLVLAPTDTFGIPVNPGDPNVSYAYRYLENSALPPARPEFAPFIVRTASVPWAYQGFGPTVPFAAFDLRKDPPSRLAIGHLENNVYEGRVDGRYWPGVSSTNTIPGSAKEWFVVFDLPYREIPDTLLARDLSSASVIPAMWLCTATRRSSQGFSAGDQFLLQSHHALSAADTFRFTAPAVDRSRPIQEASVARVGVFPNPYVCGSEPYYSQQRRFVTLNNLPPIATIRIYNLAGHLVRTLRKEGQSQFLNWDLANDSGIVVASGMYLIHVEMPEIGVSKILKLAVIQSGYMGR